MHKRGYNSSSRAVEQSSSGIFSPLITVIKFIHNHQAGIRRRLFCYPRIIIDIVRPKRQFCLICGHKVGKFYPVGISSELFTHHHVIGAGVKDNCLCPYCNSEYRVRWQYYVLQHFTDITSAKGIRVLHFAPERPNSRLIRSNLQCEYITADIVSGRADYQADITNLHQFADNSFDYVIANHVLEHISDEAKAFSELKRVLKKDGKLIISFPICTDMLTYEDSSITSREGRLKAFGQEDHVRIYGTDFKERIESYGLDVMVYTPSEALSPAEIEKYALIPDDVMMVCTPKA